MTDNPVPWLLMLPLLWAVLSLLVPRWWRDRLLWGWLIAMAAVTVGLWQRVAGQGPDWHPAGGWLAPLGIVLRADGAAVWFVTTTTAVAGAVAIYARRYLRDRPAAARHFWPLLGFLWTGLNGLWLTSDLFNIYVCLELSSLSAVGLSALSGQSHALAAALRYLLAALLGSLAWLLGIALLYAAHGTLDLTLLSATLQPGATVAVALALMTTGMLLKTALVPLHGWLPPAHGGALTPVSALLSGLVIMGAFYVLARLWLTLAPALGASAGLSAAMQLLGLLGAAAVCWGGWQALRQPRLKMIVAYSTVAQIGYCFLLFPLAVDPAAGGATGTAWEGTVLMVTGHALAKAAMFLAVGNLVLATGSQRVRDLAGVGHFIPLSLFSFGLAAISLMGLPPSIGFNAKWLLLTSAVASGQWWWAVVLLVGGLLTAGYLFRVFRCSFREDPDDDIFIHPPLQLDLVALALAAAAIALGLASAPPLRMLQIAGTGAAL